MYCYILSEKGDKDNPWEVGHYTPDGKWVSEGRYSTVGAAAARVHYLNGGN